MPNWPWSGTPIINCKGGDVLVHYAGILAFWVVGLGGRKLGVQHCIPIAIAIGLVGANNRGGLLTFALIFTICLLWRPVHQTLWQVITVGLCGLILLLATNMSIRGEDTERTVSTEQLIANIRSVVSESNMGDLDNTKRWRILWWSRIVDYTVFGPYFMTGKGFGISLAEDDGFQVRDEHGMDDGTRSPHNGHLTMLARAGVPGLILWLAVHLFWACAMCGELVASRRKGEVAWTGLFLFLLAYWLAFMVNGSFDVFLEGPMGGIWLWTIYGVGLAAISIHRLRPDVLLIDKINGGIGNA